MPQKKVKLPKGKLDREVPVLFPQTEVEPTTEELAYFKTLAARGPYAFCIDRQSMPKNAKDVDATGMKRRVEAIMSLSRQLNIYTCAPTPVAEPRKGQLPFVLDGECPYLWYFDGTDKRATGYAANQNARPRLWRGFLLAQALATHRCSPKAFFIGEGTRLFRDEGWLTHFVRALWKHSIEVHDGLFGRVDKHTLSGYIAYITAVSGWLGMVGEGARNARRRDHRLIHRNPGLGLKTDSYRVWGDPETWPIIVEMVERLWDQRLLTTLAAAQWIGTMGYPRTQAWVVRLLHGTVLDGLYTNYDKQYQTRLLKQKGGLFFDLDITPGGNRRWLITPREGEVWRIEHLEGTHPIDPQKLRAVRSRIFRAQGRPRRDTPPEGRLIEPRQLRCLCGHSVAERKETYPDGSPRPWTLTCRATNTIRTVDTCDLEEAKQKLPEHVRYRMGQASPAIWDRLVEGLLNSSIDPNDQSGPDWDKEEVLLRQNLETAQSAFDRYQEWVRQGHEGDMNDPNIAAGVNRQRQELSQRLNSCQRDLEIFSARLLNQNRHSASITAARESLRWITSQELTDDDKRAIIEQVVDEVVIDLGTGQFTIHVNTCEEALRQLQGQIAPGEDIINGSRTTYNLVLALQGCIAA